MNHYEVAIIGAGIAGASVACEIAAERRVLLLEAEDQPGYHSTGRSAAFWTESYGGPQVQPLTTASKHFLENPPSDFSENGFLQRRGVINIARSDDAHLVDQFIDEFDKTSVVMARWDETQLRASVPNLKPEWTEAVYERDCCDIDVARLHMAYLRSARRNGAVLKCNARIQTILKENGKWILKTAKESFSADVVVNAAGAWADEIARIASVKPIGIMPLRRTMVQLRTEPRSLPEGKLIVALDGSFYFKPEVGGSYWLSPHDETEAAAADVAAEELDIAIAIDRFQSVLDVEIKSVTRKWAGLRSFAPDRLPVYGFDIDQPNFFWFAGQGGFGIQTAPAAAKLAKALLLDRPFEEMVQSINTNLYDPARFS